MEHMGSARGGARGARARAVKGPAARTLGKACARGLPGLCYLLSVSWPARHFLTAPSTGRGQGPSPVSKGFSLGFPACRAWRPGAGRPGWGWLEAEGRHRPAVALYPDTSHEHRRGLHSHPGRKPQARRQRDTALGLSAARSPSRPWGPSPLCPHPSLLPPRCRLPSESSPHSAPACCPPAPPRSTTAE